MPHHDHLVECLENLLFGLCVQLPVVLAVLLAQLHLPATAATAKVQCAYLSDQASLNSSCVLAVLLAQLHLTAATGTVSRDVSFVLTLLYSSHS